MADDIFEKFPYCSDLKSKMGNKMTMYTFQSRDASFQMI